MCIRDRQQDDRLALRVPLRVACHAVALLFALARDLLGAVHRPDKMCIRDRCKADETCISSAHPTAYGYTLEQWQSGEVSTEDVYDHEVAGDPVFDEIVRELTDQANAWLRKEADRCV